MDEPRYVATISDELAILRMLLSIEESIGQLQTAIAALARGADRYQVQGYLEHSSDALRILATQIHDHVVELQNRQPP